MFFDILFLHQCVFWLCNLALRLLKPWYVMNMWHFVITCVYVSLYWLIFLQAFCKILMQKGILKKPIFFLNAMIIDTKMVFQKSMINWKVVFIEKLLLFFYIIPCFAKEVRVKHLSLKHLVSKVVRKTLS